MAGATDVVIHFIGDSSKLRAEAAKVEGTGGKLKTWAKGVGAAIGAAFAVDQIRRWVGAASELQDATAASQQIFGNASKAVLDFAKNADTAFGMSKQQAIDGANTFATFGKSAGISGGKLADFSTDLVGLAGDLASFKGTSPEEAITAIGAALRGETEPIRQYGVLLDDATLRSEALRMGLIKNTKTALTPQQKVLAAQAQIFKQTGDAQGDFERTSDSAANQQKKFQAEMENTQAALGTALLPVLQKILPILQKMAGFIEKNAGWLVPLAGAVLAIVAAVKAWSIAQAILNAIMAANPIGLIVIAIAALIAGIVLLVTHFDVVKEAAGAVWQAMQVAWDAILGVIQKVWTWIKANWPTLLAILAGPIGVAVLLIVKHWNTIRNVIMTVVNAVIGLARRMGSAFMELASTIGSAIATAVRWIAGLPGKVVAFVKSLGEAGAKLGGAFLDGLKSGLTAAAGFAQDVADAIVGVVKEAWNKVAGMINSFVPNQIGFGPFKLDLPDNPIPTFAQGGVVTRATLGIIGEAGPEAIIPLSQMGEQFPGNVTYNVNVQVATAVDPARVGREIVGYIVEFERANGNRWRT
ncbi:MAG TPA: hypothetical protein VKB59_22485 [Micromonosporaceae bacterium]|nr:hypothetical protein [Micromonosporaceae bacterium]